MHLATCAAHHGDTGGALHHQPSGVACVGTRHAAVDSQRRKKSENIFVARFDTHTFHCCARTFRRSSQLFTTHTSCANQNPPTTLCLPPSVLYARRLVVPTSFTTTSHVCRSQGVVAHWSTTPDGSPGQGNREGARCGSRHLQRGHTHVSEGTQHTQHTHHTSLSHDRSTAPPATPTPPDSPQP